MRRVLVSTAEHVLAALRGLGVDNATIEVDGPEIPIMDGSAADFVEAIDRAALSNSPRRAALSKSSSRACVTVGDSSGELRPHAGGFRIEAEIVFAHRRSVIKPMPSI